MNVRLKLIVIVMTTVALVSSCSRGLRILFYNNSGQGLTLIFDSDENTIVRELNVGQKTTLVYKLQANITIVATGCEFLYELPPYDQSYDEFIPSPRERPFRIDLQIQDDYRFYIVPTNSELPVASNDLADQPEPFFPVKPMVESCEAD